MTPVAHSPRGEVPAQAYREHIENVRQQAVAKARSPLPNTLVTVQHLSMRLRPQQFIMTSGSLTRITRKYCVANRMTHCPLLTRTLEWQSYSNCVAGSRQFLSPHTMPGCSVKLKRGVNKAKIFRNLKVADYVDKQLENYVALHSTAGCPTPGWIESGALHKCGFTRRVALSCLVDADHSDTARHYGNEVRYDPPELRWQERLAALDQYVARLPEGSTERERHRNYLRRQMYDACRAAKIESPIRSCDAPVGSGKTTAVMAYLLQVAQQRELRHIFVVLPYTNIIKQSVEVYREALVLPGERPEDVVAEHHHQADFEDVSLRQLATLWRAPVIVTTAVQFFETLASHHPARLRKLHELPGSAVFVDETHATLPSHLWPQVWCWLETWARDWGGHIVLASGSLPRFWELTEFVDPPKQRADVPDLVPDSLRNDLEQAEKCRVIPQQRKEPLDCDGLVTWVSEAEGPRLLILNTVQSAAVVAERMRKAGHDVLHLSTALAPIHRNRIVEQIKERLKRKDEDWILVATSCVEAGMDFSFRTGFRESCSTSSLIQIGGRISRNAEHAEAVVWDFRVRDSMLSQHPGFTVPRRVLDKLFSDALIQTHSPSELAKEAMRREVTAGGEKRAEEIRKAEDGMEYPQVSGLCRVIDSDTRLVVIDPDLVEMLRRREPVGYRQLLLHSVQIWTSKIVNLPVKPVFSSRARANNADTLYAWTAAYDPDFLGYMAGVIPLLEGLQEGCFIA